MLTFPQAVVLGIVQGITELLPISSDGHLVIVPAWLGWNHLIHAGTNGQSSYLQFIVAVHIATAFALLIYFRRDWVRIIGGFFRSLRTRRATTLDERLGWLIVAGTIPVGIAGILLVHWLERAFTSPLAVAALLIVNGCILLGAEALRRRAAVRRLAHEYGEKPDEPDVRRLDTLKVTDAVAIGTAQIPALLGGISRSGTTIATGLVRDFDHADAARFSFLLATPAIFGAGVLELPSMFRGSGAYVETLVAAVCAFVAALASVGFLMRFLASRRSLLPFGIYCLLVGAISVIRFI